MFNDIPRYNFQEEKQPFQFKYKSIKSITEEKLKLKNFKLSQSLPPFKENTQEYDYVPQIDQSISIEDIECIEEDNQKDQSVEYKQPFLRSSFKQSKYEPIKNYTIINEHQKLNPNSPNFVNEALSNLNDYKTNWSKTSPSLRKSNDISKLFAKKNGNYTFKKKANLSTSFENIPKLPKFLNIFSDTRNYLKNQKADRFKKKINNSLEIDMSNNSPTSNYQKIQKIPKMTQSYVNPQAQTLKQTKNIFQSQKFNRSNLGSVLDLQGQIENIQQDITKSQMFAESILNNKYSDINWKDKTVQYLQDYQLNKS